MYIILFFKSIHLLMDTIRLLPHWVLIITLLETWACIVVIVPLLSPVQLFGTPWTTACKSFLSLTIFEFSQTHVHWVEDVKQPSYPLLPPSSPALNLSQHEDLFQWVSSSRQVVKVLSFSFSISPSNEYSELISSRRTGWISLLSKGFSSLFQHHSSKASILSHSAFFMVQL